MNLIPSPEIMCNRTNKSDDALRSQAAMPSSIKFVIEAAISQTMHQNTVVTLICGVDPAARVNICQDICQDIHTGYRAVVDELQSSKKMIDELMSRIKDMQEDISLLLKRDAHQLEAEQQPVCRKKRCKRMTSGTSWQCDHCLSSANRSRTKRRKLGVSI
jgi:hypothetical protein